MWTFISHDWRIFIFQVFNLGEYRRTIESQYSDHSYFDPKNEKGALMREQICQLGIEDVLKYLVSLGRSEISDFFQWSFTLWDRMRVAKWQFLMLQTQTKREGENFISKLLLRKDSNCSLSNPFAMIRQLSRATSEKSRFLFTIKDLL